ENNNPVDDGAVRGQHAYRVLLVLPHLLAISDRIRGKDAGQATLDGQRVHVLLPRIRPGHRPAGAVAIMRGSTGRGNAGGRCREERCAPASSVTTRTPLAETVHALHLGRLLNGKVVRFGARRNRPLRSPGANLERVVNI